MAVTYTITKTQALFVIQASGLTRNGTQPDLLAAGYPFSELKRVAVSSTGDSVIISLRDYPDYVIYPNVDTVILTGAATTTFNAGTTPIALTLGLGNSDVLYPL